MQTLIHSRLQVGMATYKNRFPSAEVLLFQPERDEYRMFFADIFSFQSRRAVCELAYQSTRRDHRRRADQLEPALARHGFRLRTALLEDEGRSVWRSVRLVDHEPQTLVSKRLNRALAAPEDRN